MRNLQEMIEVKKEAIELFKKGLKCNEISRILNLDRHIVSNTLKKEGFTFSPCGKNNINSNSFNKINSHEKAYWLGFLYADGSLHKGVLELSLTDKDNEHLLKFKNFLKSESKITTGSKIYDKKYNKTHYRCRFAFRDTIIYKDLIKLGCTPKKSLVLKFPTENQVPEKFVNSFILGYFDGDGHISDPQKKSINVSLIGTLDMLENISKHSKIIFPKYRNKGCAIEVNEVSICGDNARKFLKYVYQDCKTFLKRKKDRYTQFIARYNRDIIDEQRKIGEH